MTEQELVAIEGRVRREGRADDAGDGVISQRSSDALVLAAEVRRLREALRLALLWLPDPTMHEQMSPGARKQLEQIRAALGKPS